VFELFLLREAISGATCVVTQLNPETLAQVSERALQENTSQCGKPNAGADEHERFPEKGSVAFAESLESERKKKP
jgi:hypothetical protein